MPRGPALDFPEQLLDAESQARHGRNVKLQTQQAHFPSRKRPDHHQHQGRELSAEGKE
jgi:hypothetical protein